MLNGGQAQVAIESACILAESGYEVLYFAACGPVDQRLKRDGIEVMCLDQHDILSDPNRHRAALRGLWNRKVATALHEVCAAADPTSTVLHCHGFAKALSPSIGPTLTHGPIRSVFTMHEFFLACPNGGFYDYQKDEICTRRALGVSCLTTNCDVRHIGHKGWRVARQMVVKKYAGMPSGLSDIIYISNLQKKIMSPYFGNKTRLHYVPNPMSSSGSAVNASANSIFLFIGRLSPEKGACLFAEAARKAGVPAVFVGDGSEREAVLSINPDATVTGWLDREEVADWIGRARCVVFPSVWYETFGLVAYEALFRQVPVICGTWNAAAEAVEDCRNGLLFQTPDSDALAESITALKNPDHPVFSGITSSKFIATAPLDHLARLVEVYEGLLDRSSWGL